MLYNHDNRAVQVLSKVPHAYMFAMKWFARDLG